MSSSQGSRFRGSDERGLVRFVVLFAVLIVFFTAISRLLTNRAGHAFGRVLLPKGKASPYQHDFSFEKTLVMQNRVAEALESYEERIRAYPDDTQTMLEAAELNATKGSMARAVELFRSVRQLPDASQSHRLNATNRLIDVYTRGSEANEENVQKELRYLIASFPDTQAAAHARNVLARLETG